MRVSMGAASWTTSPPWTDQHLSMEVKLKDYLDGATVLFDAAGNVVDGRLQSDYISWRG